MIFTGNSRQRELERKRRGRVASLQVLGRDVAAGVAGPIPSGIPSVGTNPSNPLDSLRPGGPSNGRAASDVLASASLFRLLNSAKPRGSARLSDRLLRNTPSPGAVVIPAPSLSYATPPEGAETVAYSLTPTLNGAGVTISKTSGTLPPGLSLNTATGAITGTPTTAGTYGSIVIRATNSSGYVEDTISITVYAVPEITTTTLPDGTVDAAYNETPSVTGKSGGTWDVSAGALPAGLSLDGSTGAVAGTPTTAASYDFTLRYTDPFGLTDTQAYTVEIAAAEYLNDPLTNGDQVDTGVSGSSTWNYSAAGAYYDGVTAGLGMIRWQSAPNTPNDADFSVKVEPRYNITTQFVTIDVMLDAYPGNVARNAFTVRHLNTTLTLLKCDDTTGEQTVATASVGALLGSNGERLYQIVVHDNGDDTYDVVVSLDGTPEITQANVPHIGGFGTDTGIRWYSPGPGYAVWISDALGV